VTQTKKKPALREAKTDLTTLYRPLGLKAVLAAHTVLKGKPPVKKFA
jgi:hypothetical protein